MTVTEIPDAPVSTKRGYDHRVQIPEGVSGNVSVRRFTVERNTPGQLAATLKGRGCRPGTYTELREGDRLWMTDTTAEWYDHLHAVHEMRRRGGRVLINGLGVGMVVKAALASPNVEHVDVVERNADIIALVGPTYESQRCTIHHADAYEISWLRGTRWSVAWHDIWPDICADNRESMTRLRRKYGRRVQWQDCWSAELLRTTYL